MKKTKVLAVGLALSLALVGCGAGGKTGSRTSDKPYMSIDGKEVSKKEFYQNYDLYAQVFALQQQLNVQIVSIFQRDYIVRRDLEKNNIKITDEEYKKAIDAAVNRIGSKEAYDDYLDFMNTTKEVFEQNIKSNLENEKHNEWFVKNHPVKDEDLKKVYEANKDELDWVDTKHILVKTKEEADEVYKKLKAGEDFKKLSDKYSTDKTAKSNDGRLGKLNSSELDSNYAQAAAKLKKGEFSQPVKSQFGYHIIYLNDKAVGLEDHKEELKNSALTNSYESYISAEAKKLEIKFYDKEGKEIKPEDENNSQGENEPQIEEESQEK